MDNLQAAEAGGDAMLGSLQVSMAVPQCSWWAADALHVLDVFQADGGRRRRPVAKGKGAWRATGEEQGELAGQRSKASWQGRGARRAAACRGGA
jgi:hypothetical protein